MRGKFLCLDPGDAGDVLPGHLVVRGLLHSLGANHCDELYANYINTTLITYCTYGYMYTITVGLSKHYY